MDPEAFRNSPSGTVTRSLAGDWTFMPHPLPPPLGWSEALVTGLSAADRALGRLAGFGQQRAWFPRLPWLLAAFMRREAVLSSSIEGTVATLAELYTYEAVQLSLLATPRDAEEVFNYVRALERGIALLPELPISQRLLREVHATLFAGQNAGRSRPGEIRTIQNLIGPGRTADSARFVPPPPERLQELLGALEQYIHQDSPLPPLIRIGLIHYQFEAIHPFVDGNGRVGRLLIVLLLIAWGLLPGPLLYLSGYFDANRDRYSDLLLAVSRDGAWEAWLVFFLNAVETQAEDALARANRLLALRTRYHDRIAGERAADRLRLATDYLFERPLLTVAQMAESLDLHFSVANRYVEHLEALGILREITGQARNRVYRADEILEILEAPPDG